MKACMLLTHLIKSFDETVDELEYAKLVLVIAVNTHSNDEEEGSVLQVTTGQGARTSREAKASSVRPYLRLQA